MTNLRGILAVVAAGVAHWIFGAGWFTALGSIWVAGTRIPDAEIAAMRAHPAVGPYVLTLVMDLLMAWALLWLMRRLDQVSVKGGVTVGLLTGVCLIGAAMITEFAFEAKPVSFDIVAVGYPVLGMGIMGLILGAIAAKRSAPVTSAASTQS